MAERLAYLQFVMHYSAI